MERYYAQGFRQPLYRYAPLLGQQSPARPRHKGTGILKYPFGFCDTQKEHSVKTLRFEMDQPPELAPPQPQSDGPDPLVNAAEGTGTSHPSFITSAYTAGAADDDEPGKISEHETATPSSPASTVESVDLSVSGGRSSSVTSGRSDELAAESGIASSSARTSFTSFSSRSLPKDMKRYFRRYVNAQLPAPSSGAVDEDRGAQRGRDSWRATSRRCALLAALATLSTLLLAGISAEIYGMLVRGGKARTPLMPLEDTIAVGPPEPEGRAIRVAPPRVIYRGGKHSRSVTPENEWGTDGVGEEGRQSDPSAYTSGANTEKEHLPASTAITVDHGDNAATEPADLQEIIGDLNDGKETLWAAYKSRSGSACEAPSFTYCQRPRHEFYYESAIRACVATAAHQLGVCTRGANRFDSKRSCLEACVKKKRPSGQCSHASLFKECDSADVLGTWWYFDGRSCRSWNFTSGLCPAHADGGAFVSREECLATCAGRRGRSRLCRVSSRPDYCGSAQLRFPYFAVAGVDKKKSPRCLLVSSANYQGHRCLVGTNRFFSMKTCHKTCVGNRSDTKLRE
ncbi:uncharacterized protein LOC142570339 isoform X2 [Dermacentor variabilis]|uniref:uncharacterized protein LOC142570339 isoform X2 n=1 Tax=Dermacentor variabilis TaxID=34621 RepID=UPI003F5C90B3